jgi:hypothetical protein
MYLRLGEPSLKNIKLTNYKIIIDEEDMGDIVTDVLEKRINIHIYIFKRKDVTRR